MVARVTARMTARRRSAIGLVGTVVLVSSLAAGIGTASRADAAAPLVCPPAAGETAVPAEEMTRPVAAQELDVVDATGEPVRAYAGMMIPQAVVADPATGRTYIAYYAPDAGGSATNPKPVRMVVAAVDGDGVTVERTVLANAGGTAVLFSQGAATETAAGGNVNDSHNSLAMEIDAAGFVHVAGNTHNNELLYWRGTTAHSVATMGYKSTLAGVKVFPNGVAILAASKDRVASYPEFTVGPGRRELPALPVRHDDERVVERERLRGRAEREPRLRLHRGEGPPRGSGTGG